MSETTEKPTADMRDKRPRRAKFRRIMTWALAAGVLAFLIVPLVLPFQSSGTKTFTEAAGSDATFLDVDGLDVFVEVTPYTGTQAKTDVPVFILMHGFGASTFSWREVTQPLSKLGDVVAYDRPAFGFTERPDQWLGESPYGYRSNVDILSAVIEEYGDAREIVLIGHSAGGQIAAAYAEDFPERVQRLILVDPAIYTTGGVPAGWNWFLDIPQIDRLGPFLVQGIANSGVELLYRSYYNPTLIDDEILAGYRAPLEIAGWEEALWEFTKAPRAEAVVERLPDITQPTLLISGEEDTIVPVADTERLATVIPNSTFIIITQSAHLPHEEQPQVFVHTVTEWMTS